VDGFAFIIAYCALISPVGSWWLLICFLPLNKRKKKKPKETATKPNQNKKQPLMID
jgi:di/tricarboxylate transporter